MNRINQILLNTLIGIVLFNGMFSAFAASSSCSPLPMAFECYTGSVPANKVNHFVHIDISSYVDYSVIDSRNGQIVYQGTTGLWGVRKTITGLYSEYKVRIYNTAIDLLKGSHARIDNN